MGGWVGGWVVVVSVMSKEAYRMAKETYYTHKRDLLVRVHVTQMLEREKNHECMCVFVCVCMCVVVCVCVRVRAHFLAMKCLFIVVDFSHI